MNVNGVENATAAMETTLCTVSLLVSRSCLLWYLRLAWLKKIVMEMYCCTALGNRHFVFHKDLGNKEQLIGIRQWYKSQNGQEEIVNKTNLNPWLWAKVILKTRLILRHWSFHVATNIFWKLWLRMPHRLSSHKSLQKLQWQKTSRTAASSTGLLMDSKFHQGFVASWRETWWMWPSLRPLMQTYPSLHFARVHS